MTTVIELPSKIDHSAVEQLMENLKSNDGKPVRIDASASKGIGGLASQVMMAALQKWQRDNLAFQISTSEAVEADLKRLGLFEEFNLKEQSE